VHFASIKHPLIGDGKYGDFAANRAYKMRYGFDHQFLHASSISFKNITGTLAELKNKTFFSPLTPEENTLLEALRKEKGKIGE
jgi:23S rRNA pseudouridine955/2504/2580 synthase